MTTTKEYVPGKPTIPQADYLAQSVRQAYGAGWKGSMRESARPKLVGWVPRPTRIAMRSKGLIEFADDSDLRFFLTKHGIAAGEEMYHKMHAISAREAADKVIEKRQAEEQARQDRKDKIAHLFRGLYLHRESGYRKKGGKKYRTVAAHIEDSSTIQMNEEDLLALGEGIEALR